MATYDLGVNYFKDDPELRCVALEPKQPLTIPSKAKIIQRTSISVYNRVGGLLERLSEKTGIDPAAVLAVWVVESSGLPFSPNHAVIRVEVHQFFEHWGKRNRQAFDAHFRFGGHNKQPGNAWENQEYRAQDTGVFRSVHHNQSSEYAALTLAQVIADDEAAFSCTSIGGCQIMMMNHASLGYTSAREMHDAFQESERAQVCGFFDFCQQKAGPKPGDLINYLRDCDWSNFARFYNGPARVATYGTKLKSAHQFAAECLAALPAA